MPTWTITYKIKFRDIMNHSYCAKICLRSSKQWAHQQKLIIIVFLFEQVPKWQIKSTDKSFTYSEVMVESRIIRPIVGYYAACNLSWLVYWHVLLVHLLYRVMFIHYFFLLRHLETHVEPYAYFLKIERKKDIQKDNFFQ